jgi:methionyl-tRNA formyltransferase
MRAAVLTSTSLRHRYFLHRARSAFDVCIALQEPKKATAYKPAIEDSDAVRTHFEELARAEQSEFGKLLKDEIANHSETVDNINEIGLIDRLRQENIDVVFLFGTSILNRGWLEAFPNRIINLHLGLSPFYRGTATLFWPIANGELECVGATIHLAVDKVDAGGILRRIKADPRIGDSYYTLTTRLVRRAIDAVPQTACEYLRGRLVPVQQSFDSSRAYRRRDFDAEALARALKFIGNGLTADQINTAARSDKCACSQ